MSDNKKIIVLDTSVILYDKKSIENFHGCEVLLPLVVLEELDRFKEKPGSLGENARYANRLLDSLRTGGSLHDGVALGEDSSLRISLRYPEAPKRFPLNHNDSDNKILLEALQIQSEQPSRSVVVVSKDINLRVKCDAVGLKAEDYYCDYIDVPEEQWNGVVELEPEGGMIEALYNEKSVKYDSDLSPNTYVLLKSQTGQSALCYYDALNTSLVLIPNNELKLGGSSLGVRGKNKEQRREKN